jgi:hypothetical protein
MDKQIVNLSHGVVTQTIEDVLETYPSHPYQQAFANPDLRQKLTAYVLSRIPSSYITVDGHAPAMANLAPLSRSLKQRHDLLELVHHGIQTILTDDWEWAERHIPEAPAPGFAPSTWFG